MIIQHYLYKCLKCNHFKGFDDIDKDQSTKCPYCKTEMILVDSYEYDDSDAIELEKPSEPTVDHYKLKAQLEGRKAIKCPTCGSYHTNKISTVGRVVSVGFWGLGSSKIGKTYECKKCGYKW